MVETENNPSTAKLSKKQLRKQVYEKLAGALAEYKTGFNEKKFDSRLKKVSKIFAVDIAKAVKNGKLKNQKKDSAEN